MQKVSPDRTDHIYLIESISFRIKTMEIFKRLEINRIKLLNLQVKNHEDTYIEDHHSQVH